MLWVIERLQFFASEQTHFIDTLKRLNCKYLNVDVMPFTHKVTPLPKEKTGIVAMGSTLLTRAAKDYGWTPGVWWSDIFRYENWFAHYGDNLLNHDAIIQKFSEIDFEGSAFIRPCEDLKAFSGTILEDKDIVSWKEKTLGYANTSDTNLINDDTCVILSSVKPIIREFRFFVVNGKVVTGCQYRSNGKHIESPEVSESATQYAQSMVDMWSPDMAFVLDVAETVSGFKVIEINNFNSAGLYMCDVEKIIQAVESIMA